MDNDEKQEIKCAYCEDILENNDYYLIYCLKVETDIHVHYLGIMKLMDEVSEYVMNKSYHLSASQIILLRPDIMKVFLEERFGGEKVNYFHLKAYIVCYNCYTEYQDMIPLM